MINLFITGQKPNIQAVPRPDLVELIVIDLFCGAGGTTTGFSKVRNQGHPAAIIAACVNHDPKALESHWKNHPEVVHFEEDIRTLELSPLVDLINDYRAAYPHAKIVLWASLECTNFSKAKGGQPRDADSRTLADHLDRYIIALNPDYVQIENVVEFMSWGPLDSKGKPVSRKNGSDWMRWRKHINSFGYWDEWKELNSADFGAYTSRNRLFGCFAKEGLPIVWPKPTHAKNPKKEGLFGEGLKKWKAVKDVLDFEDEGKSIFNRKRALSPRTLERIYAGLIKYVAGGKDQFLVKWNSMSKSGGYVAPSIEDPCGAITTQNRLGVAFIQKYFSGKPEGKVIPVDGPAGTLTTVGGQTLVQASFIQKHFSGNPSDKCTSIENPIGSLTTKCHQSLVQSTFLSKYYGNGDNTQSIDEPAGTLTTKDRFCKAQINWIDREYKSSTISSIYEPLGTLPTVPKANLAQAFILNTNFGNQGKSIEEPAPTLLASRRHYYIVNPSHGGHTMATDVPCPVIVARQDKSPLYLMQVDNSPMMVFESEGFLNEDDYYYFENGKGEPSIRAKIVEFMFLYDISDIKMRMLKVAELLPIQGFPTDYHLVGNQSDQKKFIGNSVVPHVVTEWGSTFVQILKLRKSA